MIVKLGDSTKYMQQKRAAITRNDELGDSFSVQILMFILRMSQDALSEKIAMGWDDIVQYI